MNSQQPATNISPQRRLRLMLLATGLLIVPLLGQVLAVRDLSAGQISEVAFLFELAGIFFIPTSVILSLVIVWTVRKSWRQHWSLLVLAALNTVISINLIWFLVGQCNWAQVFHIYLENCQG